MPAKKQNKKQMIFVGAGRTRGSHRTFRLQGDHIDLDFEPGAPR